MGGKSSQQTLQEELLKFQRWTAALIAMVGVVSLIDLRTPLDLIVVAILICIALGSLVSIYRVGNHA